MRHFGSIGTNPNIALLELLTNNPTIERNQKVRGDSMNKIVHDGHYAILCKTDRVESGEVAAVIVNGYDATLKRVILLDRGVLLEPSSYNPEHTPKMYLDEEAKDIKVIGKLVAVMSPPDFKF